MFVDSLMPQGILQWNVKEKEEMNKNGLIRLLKTHYIGQNSPMTHHHQLIKYQKLPPIHNGLTFIENCQMLCKTHNRAKGNR